MTESQNESPISSPGEIIKAIFPELDPQKVKQDTLEQLAKEQKKRQETKEKRKPKDERLGLPSASSWHRYEKCHGSYQLEQEARRLGQEAHATPSDAAIRGKLIHAWLAGIPDEDGREIQLSDSEQQTADFLRERAIEQTERIFGQEPARQLVEKRLWLEVNGRRAASGRFDRCLYTPEVALVQDFKSGWSEPVEAEQNAQMKLLAVLVGLHMPRTVRKVVVQVISGPYGVTEATYDLPALAKAYADVLRTLKAIGAPDAPFAPSAEACKWCPALNICQAVKDLVKPITKLQLSALPDGARGAKLLDEVELLQEHLDSIREYYAGQLTVDPAYDLPGYAMVPGNVRREVTDWDAARQRLGEWLDMEEIEGAANYRLGDLEKALGRKLKLKGKELKDRLAQILNGLIELRENSASLKRVSGRPQIVEIAAP